MPLWVSPYGCESQSKEIQQAIGKRLMTFKQIDDARFLESALREMAHKEKAEYKRRTLYDAANFLRDLINDGDEIPAVDDL